MKKKPDGIPLESLLDNPGFARNFELFVLERDDSPGTSESSRLRRALISLVTSYAIDHAKSKGQHVANSKMGGAASAQARCSALIDRNEAIAEVARRKLNSGYSEREISGIIAQQYGLNAKTIRRILTEHGVLKKRK